MPVPGPLELAKMHAAEIADHIAQIRMLMKLTIQIMVGRKVRVPQFEVPCEITEVCLMDGKVQLYGRLPKRSRIIPLVDDISKAEMVVES